jgi:uncharacterized repeat protein (TIGR02543 family)
MAETVTNKERDMSGSIKKQFSGKTAICLFGVILFLILSSCSGPFSGGGMETATLTINLGGGGRAASPDDATLAQLIYVAVLSGPSTIKAGPTEPGTRTLSVSVVPGRWNITVTAYLDGEVFAEGSDSVDVRSGQKSSVSIKMQQIVPVDVIDPSLLTLAGSITISPVAATVGTTLTASYSGSEPVTLNYRWNKDGAAISGANTSSYTPTQTGSYTVTVSASGYNGKTSTAVYVEATVTYSTSGATSGTAPTTQTTVLGSVTIAYGTGLTKNGYMFGGWNEDLNGMGTNRTAGSTYTLTNNITLYAKWVAPEFNSSNIGTFANWLSSQGGNTAASAYNIKMNVSSANDFAAILNTLNDPANANKYFTLDLSGSSLYDDPTPPEIFFEAFSNASINYGCSNLVSITFPATITKSGYNAFWGCSNLKSVTLPDSLTVVRAGCFTNCTSLTSIIIPAGVNLIETNAFAGCGLTKVTFQSTGITIQPGSGSETLPADLITKYNSGAGGQGTYEKQADGSWLRTGP